MEVVEKGFDEKAQEVLTALFEKFWIIRAEEPELYQKVREREKVIRRYVTEKLGYRFIVHRYFAKLEKIPVEPEPWMGIQAFKQPLDYALFCCLLAFLESKNTDEQFLLSDMCEEFEGMYPGEVLIDWTNYEQRKSLIRVINMAKEFQLIKTVDGDIDDFSLNTEHEVLFEVPVISRYFMRSYPKGLFNYDSLEDILTEESTGNPNEYRRHRVYRKLYLSPVMYRIDKDDPDFAYLRNYRNRLRDDVEAHTDFRFEIFKNAAFLTLLERKNPYTLFPNQKAISDIVLHFANVLKSQLESYEPNEFGVIRLTEVDYQELVKECQTTYQIGWSKAYRDATLSQLASSLLETLIEWTFAKKDEETGMIFIYPALGRMIGDYPEDFKKGGSST